MPTFGQKNVNSVKNTHYGPKKSIGCHFFSIFSRKNYCLMPIYIFKNKNVHSLITHYSHANILSKKRPFSQKHCALMSNKKNHEKSPSVMPIFDQKTSILSKQHYIMSQISQQNALFLRFLTKKLSLLCPYFVFIIVRNGDMLTSF